MNSRPTAKRAEYGRKSNGKLYSSNQTPEMATQGLIAAVEFSIAFPGSDPAAANGAGAASKPADR
jgi:hypothetical protein